MKPFFFCLLCTLLLACGTKKEVEKQAELSYEFPYNLLEPNHSQKLDIVLQEISGLAWVEENIIACIQDEDALLFYYDLNTSKIINTFDFGKKNDYEGLCFHENKFYVLDSSGDLQQFSKGEEEGGSVFLKSFLKKENDTEGIAYQAKKNRLLIACKGKAGEGAEFKNKRAIYAFDLKKQEFKTKPAYLIDLDAYKNLIGKSTNFSPSGISVNPKTDNIYVISYIDRSVLVLSPKGKLLHAEMLDRKLFPQPEAVTFLPNGNLLIASEGQNKKGLIHQFEMK